MRFLYLHGFASSPQSRKARLFVDKLSRHKIPVEVPDLAPDFQLLTLTSQLKIIENALQGEPVVLIGSSMGGYLASLYAAQHPQVNRLLLLAPAFGFYSLWTNRLGPAKLDSWREKGTMNVYHYGMSREMPLGFQFIKDAMHYPEFPNLKQPCLILHGLHDAVVPFASSQRIEAEHPETIKLLSLNSDHEMTDVLDEIWDYSRDFLLNANTLNPVDA